MSDEPKLEVLGGADFQTFMMKLAEGSKGYGATFTAKEANFILVAINAAFVRVPDHMFERLQAARDGGGDCALDTRETQMAMVAVGRTLDAAPKVNSRGRGPGDPTTH